MKLTEFSATHLPLVEEEMVSFITEYTSDERLKESMIYSIHAGGKRIRPLALLATVASFDAKIDASAYQVAADIRDDPYVFIDP